jgi:hypothetical protein
MRAPRAHHSHSEHGVTVSNEQPEVTATRPKRVPVPAVAVMVLLTAVAVFVAAWKWGNWTEKQDTPNSESGPVDVASHESGWSNPAIAKTVLQVENYTYVELMLKPEECVWIASPKLNVEVGDRVVVKDYQGEMGDFHSPTLNRTFKAIHFVGGAGVVDDQDRLISVSRQHSSVDAAHDQLHDQFHSGRLESSAGRETAPLWDPTIPALEKPQGGMTIGELHAESKNLAGQTVKVRGVVVKATASVLGTNWYHLQDGSGDAETGDITITSAEKLDLGQTVTVSGTLGVNRDVGAGYFFAVLIENAVRRD